jgi:CrcB protein
MALYVAAGGAAGSVLRWLLAEWSQRLSPTATFPWGTMLINIAGSFAIGAVMTLATERAGVSPETRLLLVTGLLGGFTTFSAYSYETLSLLRAGHPAGAAVYALGSVGLGLAAAIAGRALILARG